MREDKDHRIHNVDEINKVRTNVQGLICNSIAEVQWIISKLKDEQNRWMFEGTFRPACEEQGKKGATYKQFVNDDERQPRTMQPLSMIKIETGWQPIPQLRLNEELMEGEMEETCGRLYKLVVMEGKVKMDNLGPMRTK